MEYCTTVCILKVKRNFYFGGGALFKYQNKKRNGSFFLLFFFVNVCAQRCTNKSNVILKVVGVLNSASLNFIFLGIFFCYVIHSWFPFFSSYRFKSIKNFWQIFHFLRILIFCFNLNQISTFSENCHFFLIILFKTVDSISLLWKNPIFGKNIFLQKLARSFNNRDV